MTTNRIWVPGGTGMLGQAIVRARPAEVCATSAAGVSISNFEQVLSFVNEYQPTHIINCAAYTRVDDAEKEPQAAFRANADGPENLARAALAIGATFTHFSTDYVFGGEDRQFPYYEQELMDPWGVYARSKAEAEHRLLKIYEGGWGYQIIRTSWLFGPRGKNFVDTMLDLMKTKETLRVVADQVGRPTYVGDLAEATLALAGITRPKQAQSGIYHFANHGEVSWHAFAEKILELGLEAGLPLVTKKIEAITTAEFPRPAPRPAYSVLSTEKLEQTLGASPRHYEAALREHLARAASSI